jgi:hypothetical protein
MATLSEQIWLFLEPVNLAVTSAAIFHLFRIRQQRTYPVLTLFLLFDAVVNALSLSFVVNGNERANCYLFSVASYVVPVVAFLLCPDVFRELFDRYPGFLPARKRQITSYAFAGAGAAITSASTAVFSLTKIIECKPAIVVELGLFTSFGCGIFMLAMLRSTTRLQIKIPQNTKTLACVMAFELIQQAIVGGFAIYFSLRHFSTAVDRLNVLETLLLIGTRSFMQMIVNAELPRVVLTVEEHARGVDYIARLGELVRQRGRSCQQDS